MKVETVKVKPWAQGQGEFVEINKEDFDPLKFQLYDDSPRQEAQEPVKRERRK